MTPLFNDASKASRRGSTRCSEKTLSVCVAVGFGSSMVTVSGGFCGITSVEGCEALKFCWNF